MRVLVTGGAGFIGSHVAQQFLAAGYEVAVVDDLSTGHRENVPNGATFYECDIRDERLSTVFKEVRPDVVSHHAAQMSVRVSIAEPRRDASLNVEGSIHVLECAVATGTRKIIYASTGGAIYGEPQYLPCDERHPIRPQCQYGISKHTVEHYLELYSDLYALDYTVLRYPNVYGPRQDPDGEAGVVAIFGGRMLDNQPVTIFGDGTQQRDFVFVGDVARANLLAVERGSQAIINIGSNLGTSVLDIFEALKSVTRYGLDPIFAPPRLGEVYQIYLTGGLALQLLGWQPTVTLQDGLRQTVSAMQGLHRSMLVPVPD
jgi:UDP-glucose 4-epimerase